MKTWIRNQDDDLLYLAFSPTAPVNTGGGFFVVVVAVVVLLVVLVVGLGVVAVGLAVVLAVVGVAFPEEQQTMGTVPWKPHV